MFCAQSLGKNSGSLYQQSRRSTTESGFGQCRRQHFESELIGGPGAPRRKPQSSNDLESKNSSALD